MRDDFDPAHAQMGQQPPHSFDAEQALLGAILVRNEAYERVSGFLDAQHFFDPLHQRVYAAAGKLIVEGQTASPVTLGPYFQNSEPVGGAPVPVYLGQLAINATTILNARDYGRTIRDLATRRQLILIGEDVAKAAFEADIDFPPARQIEEAENRLYALAKGSGSDTPELDHRTILDSAINLIDAAIRDRGKPLGLSTGLVDLDKRIGGLRPGHLIILGGRPSMGKSALAENMLTACQAPAMFMSMEMTAEEVALRELSAETGLRGDQLVRGEVTKEQLSQLMATAERLGQRKLIVDQSSGLTIAQVATKARRAKRQHSIELLVIDYLQLMQGTKRNNRVEDVTEITVGLKALAKELAIPVIALSQLSRKVEDRTGNRPQLSDLRESGSIEQDADEVLFVFREEYYHERGRPDPTKPAEVAAWEDKLKAIANKAEIIVAKSRHGQVGIVEVNFDGPTTKFSNPIRF
jgi:replicative DNA helicase